MALTTFRLSSLSFNTAWLEKHVKSHLRWRHFCSIACNRDKQQTHTFMTTDSAVLALALSVCPWKRLLSMLAIKSWWKLTYILMITCDSRRILGQQLRPHPINFLNIFIKLNHLIIKNKIVDHLIQMKKQNWNMILSILRM